MSTALETVSAPGSGIIAPGHVLGRYELLMPIAAGGMAMVWAARLKGTRGFQKIVAVKTMLPKLSEDAQFEQMFLDEASLASQVRHPHVVEILDLGEQEGVLFLVMEWIDGVPLNQLMKAAKAAGGMPLSIAVRVVMQTLAGLHAAHEMRDQTGKLVGLVHRDVSPQNILVTYDGVTKVVDFGVAKATAIGDGATGQGQIKGKVGYMAPEQIEGEPIDRRADVFAAGIVLYALTTGKHPFRRESDAATMYNICSPQAVLPPRKFIPEYPTALEQVLLKALAKAPADRYQTANEMLRDLDQVLPPDERAKTDEDVALFVRKLVGDRLDERRGTLHNALARADEFAQSSIARVGGAPPDPSAARASPSAFPGSTETATTWAPEPRRKPVGILVGGALLVAGVGAALALFLSGAPANEVIPAPPEPSAASQQVEKPAPAPPPTPSAPPATVEPPPARTAPTTPQARTVETGARPKSGASPAASPPPSPPSPPPTPKGQRRWMHDPGF
ncbi:MAG TPA: serine/threonine-protein kinase [Polyangiaceae bacterium]